MIQSVVYRIGLGSLRELRLSIKNLILLVLLSMGLTAVWGLQTITLRTPDKTLVRKMLMLK